MALKTSYVVMGVSGAGKSTIGALLARNLGIPFIEGDHYHSKKSIKKMTLGHPLSDEDRVGWLTTLNEVLLSESNKNGCVLSCSALKEQYREQLSTNFEDQLKWIYLHGTYNDIKERLKFRQHHFMPTSLLKSQFEILEIPKRCIKLNINNTPEKMLEAIERRLALKEFGIIGLGVMGKGLSRNLASKGISLALYNRHHPPYELEVAKNFILDYPELKNSIGFEAMGAFVEALEKPRKILVMVPAGNLNTILNELIRYLEPGDCIIDGGNSNFELTNERCKEMNKKGFHFFGCGISGGEKGALEGPSLMLGGAKTAFPMISKYLLKIAAKDINGKPCCNYVGPEGSGHFVKMVHNGIEYVEMQLLAEMYWVMKAQDKTNEEIAIVFERWIAKSDNYLLRITIDILRKTENGGSLLDQVLDKAGNKGTGNWAALTATKMGLPNTMIQAALNARYISFFKEERTILSAKYSSPSAKNNSEVSTVQLGKAYEFARIVNHHQGFQFIQAMSEMNYWNIDLGEVARLWSEGSILKSSLLLRLTSGLKDGKSLLETTEVTREIRTLISDSRAVSSLAVLHGIPIPCLTEALNFFSAITSENLPANLIQAQRDYFGSHGYQRKNVSDNTFFTSNWTSE